MADKTIYKFPALVKLINEIGYKHCKLTDTNGDAIIPYNPIHKPLAPKLKEIEKRLKHLAPGVYCISCQTRYGTKSATDHYYLGIGKYDPTQLNEGHSMPTNREREREPLREKVAPEKLLSIEQAMENMRELAELKGKVARLEAENESLREELEEYEEDEELEEGENGKGLPGFIGEAIKSLEPAIDKYFDLREREQKFKETKFLHEGGYEVPGLKKKVNGNANRNGSAKQKPVPRPGEEGWNEYIEYLLELDDATFKSHMEQLEAHDPELYQAVYDETIEEGEEEEGEEQQ
jgi:hypothetical protein